MATLNLGRTGLEGEWLRTERTWVLDPIDGTKGFLRGDQFAVALSLLDGGEPVLGLLGCPNLDAYGALFWAEKGHGACWSATHGDASEQLLASGLDAQSIFAASSPLRVSHPATGAPGLVRCEAFESKHTNRTAAEAIAGRLGIVAPPVRMDGQGKYGMIARGDAQIFTRLPRAGYQENIWDHAGAMIVEEAGGRVTDVQGRRLDFSRGAKFDASVSGIVATNGVVHDALLEALAGVL